MASVGTLRAALRDRLATIASLATYATMPSSPKAPAAAVIPLNQSERDTFSGGHRYRFAIWVYTSPGDLERAQAQIDEYLSDSGPKSIEAAIDGDPSLGGLAVNARVTGWSDYATLVDVAGGQMLACRVDCEVIA